MVLSGCSKDVEVVITDEYTKTHLNTKIGNTVRDALSEAEIVIYDGDSVEPGLDKEVEADTEIKIMRQARVLVRADGQEIPVELLGGKVSDALDAAKISLGENDSIDCNLEAFLKDDMKISVERRVKLKVTVDGNTTEVISSAETVADFLKEQKISLGEKDKINEALTENLTEGMEIVIQRTEIKKETVTETIDYEVKTEYSSSLLEGTSKVTREGTEGEKKVTYQITYIDGKEESRKVIKEEIIKEPQDQVVTKGTKKSGGTKDSGKTIVSKEKVLDCDGSGHGYYIITYSDGTIKYEDF